MGLREILQWWNVIYLAPLLVSLVWIVVTVVSGGLEGGGAGHDVGDGGAIDHDVGDGDFGDVGHDADVGDSDLGGAGHDTDTNGSSGHEASHIHAHTTTLAHQVFWILGIGRVPITLLAGVFFFCWGVFGMAANQLFEGVLKYPALYIWPSMAVTFVASFVLTRSMAAIVGRYLPSVESYGVARFELVGSMGKAVLPTSENTGTVDIKDIYGTIHRVQAKTEQDAEAIPSGAEVMVLDFDEDDKRFVVRISAL